jgi:5-formyltetrahydrofolate cyclo-ligase
MAHKSGTMEHPRGTYPAEDALRYQVKAGLRKSMQRTRALIPPSARGPKSEAIREKLRLLGVFEGARSIALFRPIERKGEVDTTGIDHDARACGLRVAYPTLEPSDPPTMTFRWVDLGSRGLDAAFEERGFGFPEPAKSAPVAEPEELELVIVPALAFDPSGNRIGYGAGFYDSILARCVNAKTIGVCFDFQMIPEVPVTEGDLPVLVVVTDKRTFSTAR